jgi:phosphatidylglycerophosphate synthase
MSHNTWIHHIARAAVLPLTKTPVTPNHLTTVRLAAGIAAASALAVGAVPWPAIGGGIFLISMVLDRADGELARLTGKTSPGGHTYDLIADSVCNALAFVGLGVGLRDSVLGAWAVPLGLLAGLAIAAVLWLVMRVESLAGARAAELPSKGGFDPDDSLLVVPIAVWLGWELPLLLAASIGAPAFALFFYARFRERLHTR